MGGGGAVWMRGSCVDERAGCVDMEGEGVNGAETS